MSPTTTIHRSMLFLPVPSMVLFRNNGGACRKARASAATMLVAVAVAIVIAVAIVSVITAMAEERRVVAIASFVVRIDASKVRRIVGRSRAEIATLLRIGTKRARAPRREIHRDARVEQAAAREGRARIAIRRDDLVGCNAALD